MLKIFGKIPSYVYLAGFLGGAAASYIFYPISEKNKKNAKSNGYPRGLINCKNDCFINVILQALAASDKVTDWLVKNKSSNSNSLFDTLANIIIKINRLESIDDEKLNVCIESSDEYEFYAAQSFKRALNAHNWSIKSEEHDCHELFQLIMDVLDEEQIESKKSLKSLNFFMPSHLKENSNSKACKSSFHGYFVNQLQCLDCNYKYPLRLETFYCLSLTLPNQQYGLKTNSVTLTECINNYFKSDHITGMKCENCSTIENENINKVIKKGFIKRQAIAKLPDCLSIQIQRNSWSDQGSEMVKQMSYVQFPQTITIDSPTTPNDRNKKNTLESNKNKINKSSHLTSIISQYSNNQFSLKQVGIGGLLGGNIKQKSSKFSNLPIKKSSVFNNNTNNDQHIRPPQKFQQYELKSAVVHYGNAHSGHFVSYRKPLHNKNTEKSADDWLQISDSDIKRCKQYNLFSSNVYMLFYDKVTSLC